MASPGVTADNSCLSDTTVDGDRYFCAEERRILLGKDFFVVVAGSTIFAVTSYSVLQMIVVSSSSGGVGVGEQLGYEYAYRDAKQDRVSFRTQWV